MATALVDTGQSRLRLHVSTGKGLGHPVSVEEVELSEDEEVARIVEAVVDASDVVVSWALLVVEESSALGLADSDVETSAEVAELVDEICEVSETEVELGDSDEVDELDAISLESVEELVWGNIELLEDSMEEEVVDSDALDEASLEMPAVVVSLLEVSAELNDDTNEELVVDTKVDVGSVVVLEICSKEEEGVS